MSTGSGLTVYHPKQGLLRNYDKIDGLQGNEFSDNAAVKLSSGELLFGGRNGFNIFRPEDIKDNTNIPKVVITDFLLHNKPVKIGLNSPLKKSIEVTDKITLTHKDYIFSFGFAALNYLSPEKNQYKYKLEGFENEWVETQDRHMVTYTNIPPGNYTFRVIASNNDGYWNKIGASLQLSILPPWWKT
ncbi:MAG: hypothetical protein HC896_02935, partial [Bacteroidales bacterium]|nr:hypothetical protein [Bacteroidales bacterium]